ncbi:hypothetical protein FNV43_RR02075 [Rhamnella rubrinervis]|uniref:Protein kinase domain-containing protein n=1 Tax=Rhamnella rubrinervis TaxID=2594499 RepID=A0A8K0MSX3_9ROSA|nr:hypothetical protein FNV43_RR02075 [Rhamnella rubrinervis]
MSSFSLEDWGLREVLRMEGEDWEMGFLGLMGWKRKWVCGFLKEEPLIKELVSVKICGSSTSPSAFVTKEGNSFPPSRLFKRKKGQSDQRDCFCVWFVAFLAGIHSVIRDSVSVFAYGLLLFLLISMANPYKELRYTNVFEEGELLGWGGHGSVVSSEYFIDGQKYAIKKVPIDGRALYEDARREVQVLALLKHPHIAWFESDIHGKMGSDSTGPDSATEVAAAAAAASEIETIRGCLYIQQEFCESDLAKLIDRGVGEEEGYRIFLEILEGVSFIHSQGIVHGDLAPKNIFLDKNNRVKIGDFGIAKFVGQNELSQVGLEFYAAPEIPCHPDPRSDIFSLGIILFELFHKLETDHERYTVLNDLRNSNRTDPQYDGPTTELAVKLVHRNPIERPEINWIRDQVKELSDDPWSRLKLVSSSCGDVFAAIVFGN